MSQPMPFTYILDHPIRLILTFQNLWYDGRMKKIDFILALITGEGVAWLFIWLIKNSPLSLPFLNWLLPVLLPVLSIFGIWFAELIGQKFLFIYQLAKFVLVGAFFAVFDLIILNSLMAYFGITKEEILKYAIFVAISFTIVTTFKYFANKYWAFEKVEKERMEKEFGIFFLVTAISGLIQLGVASLLFKFLISVIPPLLAGNVGKILGIVVASAWNFLCYKFLVFKK
jgi:putative flippase GtrA